MATQTSAVTADELWRMPNDGARYELLRREVLFPQEVEAVLDTHPAVRESRASGEPNDRCGAVAVAENRRARPVVKNGG